MQRKTHLSPAWLQVPEFPDLPSYFHSIKQELKALGNKKPVAILAPHAGITYSGKIAATAYADLDRSAYDQVLILAPSHRNPLYEKISVEPLGIVETLFGNIEIAEELTNKLIALPHAVSSPEDHEAEHSIHIQFPFIKHFLNLPVAACMVGQWDYSHSFLEFTQSFKEAIASTKAGLERTLIIISTDFTHYGKNFWYVPFEEDIQENLNDLDHTVFHAFASREISVFEEVLRKTKATVCGAMPMKLLLAMLPEEASVTELAYTTSGILTGDNENSVSYLAAYVFADWSKNTKSHSKPTGTYTTEEKKLILDIAKQSIEYIVTNNKVPEIDYATMPEVLCQQRAAFVTIHKQGALRGCIGELLPTRPLIDVIVQRACDAAINDNRFTRVTEDELPQLDIEVSVLSLPTLVPSYNDIEIGVHGIILQKNNRSAVFLPQVPVEQNWDLETTLTHLAHKAGLAPDAWKEQAQFFVFTAEVIH